MKRRIVNFGGTRIAFSSPAERFLEALEERYRPFLEAGSRFDWELVHDPAEEVFRKRHGSRSRIAFEDRRAFFGAVPERGVEVADGVMRMLLPRLVLPDLLLHGAMLEFGGEAVLCCGSPGAGKSTLSALFPAESCCDELCRLHRTPGGFEARSLPFWTARPARLHAARIYVLEHGLRNRLVELDVPAAMKELRRHIYWPMESPGDAETVFGMLAALVSSLPVFRLAFRPDASVRTLLEDPAGHGASS